MIKYLNSIRRRELFYLTSAINAFISFFSLDGIAKKAAALVIMLEMTGALLFGLPVTPRGQALDLTKFQLKYSDEFDGTSLDETKWEGHGFDLNADTPHIRKGSVWAKEMLSVADGCLKITTAYSEGLHNGPAGYYNCGIQTRYTQRYGYYECRCILPKGEGIWAAFWLVCPSVGSVGNGGTDGAELDIFESPFYADCINNKVYMNIHYDGYGGDHTYEGVVRDFEAWWPVVVSGGCILFHDSVNTHENWGVHRLMAELKTRKDLAYLETSESISVFRKL